MKLKHCFLALSLLVAPTAFAEVISISVSRQAPGLADMQRPLNGMSKQEVEAQYGAPQAMDDPVGEPPISKWHYADYVVYFEFDRVIHSVLKHSAPATPGVQE